MKKIQQLQALRALAAILVVWVHAIDLIGNRNLPSWQTDFAYFEDIGAVGVDIFFVISGFILSLTASRNASPLAFLARRFVRVWPLYAYATLLIFLILPFEALGSGRLVRGLLLIQDPAAYRSLPVHPLGWSLMFEVCFYAMLALALCWRRPARLDWRLYLILAACLCAGAWGHYVQPLNVIGNPVILEFGLGVLIGRQWHKRPSLPPWASRLMFVAAAASLLLSAMLGYGDIANARSTLDVSNSWQRVLTWGIPAALLVAAAVYAPGTRRQAAWTVFLGDASYSIYLFSYIVLVLFDLHWPAFGAACPDLTIIGVTLVATAAGCLAYVMFERPLMRKMQGWLRAPAPAGAAGTDRVAVDGA